MVSAYVVALGCATGYLLGMSVVGYVCLLGLIKARYSQHRGISLALVALHYAVGVAALFVVPLLAYRVLRTHLPSEFGIAFGVTGLLSLAVALWVAKELNRLLTDRPPA